MDHHHGENEGFPDEDEADHEEPHNDNEEDMDGNGGGAAAAAVADAAQHAGAPGGHGVVLDEDNHHGGNEDDEDDEEEDEDDDDHMDAEGEDEEDEDEEDDDEDEDDGVVRPRVVEGGVVDAESEAGDDPIRRPASSADITLYFKCPDDEATLAWLHKHYPGHPVLRPGVSVHIGLGKNTKLMSVFHRFVTVCNELNAKANHPPAGTAAAGRVVDLDDLEFVHCWVLSDGDTAEAAALMKGDTVSVRPNQEEKRRHEQERERIQREMDRVFLDNMRHFLHGQGPISSDSSRETHVVAKLQDPGFSVLLRCQPRPTGLHLASEASALARDAASFLRTDPPAPTQRKKKRKHNELQPHDPSPVRRRLVCHGPIVSRRCPWMGGLIRRAQQAKSAALNKRAMPAAEGAAPGAGEDKAPEVRMEVPQLNPPAGQQLAERPDVVLLDDDAPQPEREQAADDVAVVHAEGNILHNPPGPDAEGSHLVQQVYTDDEDVEIMEDMAEESSPSGPESSDRAVAGTNVDVDVDDDDDLLSVTIHHPEEAVGLLLEYLYTNRVLDLGHDAFVTACKTKPSHNKGPVAPFMVGNSTSRRRWPNRGDPTISYETAVALVRLALEAELPRLALMAEVSASLLVSPANFVGALTFCQEAKAEFGRDLERLRKAAMNVILRPGSYGTHGVWAHPSFRSALAESRSVLVPTLITGTMEALQEASASAAAAYAAAVAASGQHSGGAGKSGAAHHHHHHLYGPQYNQHQKLQNQFARYDPSEWRSNVFSRFRLFDRIDKQKREDERRKRRSALVEKPRRPEAGATATAAAVTEGVSAFEKMFDGFDSDAAVKDGQPPLARRVGGGGGDDDTRRKPRRAAAVAAAAALDTSGRQRVTYVAGRKTGGGGGGGAGGDRPPRRSRR